jgi:hypothetical protein
MAEFSKPCQVRGLLFRACTVILLGAAFTAIAATQPEHSSFASFGRKRKKNTKNPPNVELIRRQNEDVRNQLSAIAFGATDVSQMTQ